MMYCDCQSRCGRSSRLVCILYGQGRLSVTAVWSSVWSEGRAGSRYLRTISRSVTRDIIDVTDIGLR